MISHNKIKYFLVGGTVRDELLGQKPKDIDIVALGCDFDLLCKDVKDMGGEIFVENRDFVTIRCRLPNLGACDIRIARQDGNYLDGRRPDSVKLADSLYEDSLTRDFSVNSMYKNLETGEILDFHNGRADLENGLLCCVGPAKLRFEEDYLRILRAMRFDITKGFCLSEDISNCLFWDEDLVMKLRDISKERVYEELRKCFSFNTWETLNFLRDYSLIKRAIFEDNICGIKLEPICFNK